MAPRHLRHGLDTLVHRIFDRKRAANGARRHARRRLDSLASQQLEQRLALTVEAFFEPTSATLVASPGSDLYLTKVVGDELWVAESSTFVGKQSIPSISTLGPLAITTGELKNDVDVETDAFPMSATTANLTSFVLSKTRLMDSGELYGEMELVQPDGAKSVWSFSSWNLNAANPGYKVSQIRFTSGPGYGGTRKGLLPIAGTEPVPFEQPRTGYYVPQFIRLTGNDGDFDGQAATLEIIWNRPLTREQDVKIKTVTYERGTAFDTGNRLVNPVGQTDDGLLPCAPARNARFTLPGTLEAGNFGIVPGTLSGTVNIDGVSLRFDTRRASTILHFPDSPADAKTQGEVTTVDGSILSVTGSYDSRGWIDLSFDARFFNQGLQYRSQTPGRVRVSADYAVSQTGPTGGDVTFFAGFDITNPVFVDMLTPGSTVHVASPLTSNGTIQIRGTNTRFDSNTTSPGVLRVESPVAPTRAEAQKAGAKAEISPDGKVLRIVPVVGSEGSGYDADNPPTVTIGRPESVPATASISRISGRLVEINLTDRGSGYATTPKVTVSVPDLPGGVQAVAEADLAAGSITAIRVTNPGSGYSFTPLITIDPPPAAAPGQPQPIAAVASAVIAGTIQSIAVPNGGFGYDKNLPPTVTIRSTTGGTGAVAVATVNDAGLVTSIQLTNGGSNYRSDTTTTIAIAAPPPSNGTRATATAVVDQLGRITGYTITNQGSGYGAVPTVTVADPVPTSTALGTAVISSGQVSDIQIAASGYGYRTAPRVTIAPPPPGSGGKTAVAKAVISNDGRVTGFTFIDRGSGYDSARAPSVFIADPDPVAVAETVTFNTAVSANEYRVAIADDPNTDLRRGRLFVSPTSKLTNGDDAAGLAFLQASQSDIVIEGDIHATSQTVYMESNEQVRDLGPFVFTTRAASGVQTGRILGTTVQVILANDLPTPADDMAVAFNKIDVRTSIASLRVRAASRNDASRREPFPYTLAIDELDDLAIDAVAASSFPIVLTVGGKLDFNATVATAGGLVIDAAGDFKLGGPVTTTRGQISLTAPNVLLNNILSVTNPEKEETLDDIAITATAGDIELNADVKALNRVRLTQRNRSASQLTLRRYTGQPVSILDNATATAEISLTGDLNDFTFSKVQVALDIAHTFVGDLTGWLVAPDGTRFRLFQGLDQANGGRGDNLTETVFDSDAPLRISNGTPPFKGLFRPDESLARLAGRKATGTWKLEVRDSVSGETGTIKAFSLLFTADAPEDGVIGGTGRIASGSIDIRADGFVGSRTASPAEGGFYLHTDTGTLEARVGRSVAIEDVGTIDIPFLTAGGLVSLRALGYDGPGTALHASLFDTTALDVSAPNGSIAVEVVTPNNVVIGNAAAIAADTAVSMLAAGNVEILVSGGSNSSEITVLDAPLAGSGGRQVRGVTVTTINGSYLAGQPGLFASTITGPLGVSGSPTLEAIFGVVPGSIRIGDRLLVANGVGTGANATYANGVYAVSRLATATQGWLLTRASDSDTAAELPSNTFVRTTDNDGEQTVYQITYDGTFTNTPINVDRKTLVAKIDSLLDSGLTFVVSTDAGTNLGVGSLGKMLQLHRLNQGPADSQLRFADSVGTIALVEELPRIARSIDIDGKVLYATGIPESDSRTVLVDGSRIVRRFDGSTVTASTSVDGFRFVRGSSGSRLAGVNVGGFTTGAAVSVNGSTAVVVESVTLGRTPATASPANAKLLNKYGVLVGDNAADVAVVNSTILSSTAAGVRIEPTAARTVLVGNTIGQSLFDNKVGVEVTNGVHRIGVRPSSAADATVRRDKPRELTLERIDYPLDLLYIGQGVSGQGIAQGTRIIDIDRTRATITLSEDTVLDAKEFNNPQGVAAVTVQFAVPRRNLVQWNLTGIQLLNGGTTVVNTDVINNASAGILIDGGQNMIGDSQDRSATASNQIHTSQGWGIQIGAASQAEASALAGNQTIQGNYFIPPNARIGDATVQNKRGAVGITYPGGSEVYGGISTGGLRKSLEPIPSGVDAGTDSRGNLHYAVADAINPMASLTAPVDAGGNALPDTDPTLDGVEVRGAGARSAATFAILLTDDGVGINKATVVKDAFILSRNGTRLVEGIHYTFTVGDDSARFQSIGGSFPLGNYSIAVTSRKAQGTTPGWITDQNNNPLADNKQFTIVLVDVPNQPTNVTAQAGDGKVDLNWSAALSSVEVEYYEIQYSTSNSGNAVYTSFSQPDPASLTVTVAPLVNGTSYYFRVRAVNKVGAGDWSVLTGPATPLSAPLISLADDTGSSNADGITSNGLVAVSGMAANATWNYSIKGGAWTSPTKSTDTSFRLPAGKYAVGDVQVRQSVGSSTSGIAVNSLAYDIDVIAPTLVRFLSSTPNGTYGLNSAINVSATLSEEIQAGSEIDVTLDTNAIIKLRAAARGTVLTGTYRVSAEQNSADLSVRGYTAGSVYDLAGNPMTSNRVPSGVDNIGGSKDIVVDTTPPAPPTIIAATDDVPRTVGVVPDGGITNDSRLVITGTTTTGTTIRVFTAGTLLGTATVTGTTWTFTTPSLTDATTYIFTARAIDAVGNEGTDSSPYSISVDLAPPSRALISGVTDDEAPITGNVPDRGLTNDTTLVISGTTDPNSTVQIFNNAVLLGSATVTGNAWVFRTGSLPDGTCTFIARATDQAGNEGADSVPYNVTIDTSGAVAFILGVSDDVAPVIGPVADGGFTNDPRLLITGITEAGSTVRIYNGDQLLGPALVDGTTWTFTTSTLANGTALSIRVQATDSAGNIGRFSVPYGVTIDTTSPPAPVITGHRKDVLAGTVEAGCTVEVFRGTIPLGFATVSGSAWNFSLSNLLDGNTYELTTRASDVAGNVGPTSDAYRLTIDRTAPDCLIESVMDDADPTIGPISSGDVTNDIGLILAGSTTESNCTVEVFDGNERLGVAAVNGRTWTFITDALTDGNTYNFRARSTDGADNRGAFSPSHAVTIDSTAPTVRRFESATTNGAYNAGRSVVIRALMSEVVSRGSSITVMLDTGALVELRAAAEGDLLEGTYEVQAGHNSSDLTVISFTAGSVTDRAGNVLADLTMPTAIDNIGGSHNIVIDTTAPVIREFTSASAAGFYRQGSAIVITAKPNETLLTGSRLAVTLNTGAVVTLVADSQGTSLIGTYVVLAGHNASSLAVVAINPVSGGDLAGNPIVAVVPPAGNLRPGIVIDTVAPTINRFFSNSANGTYRAGSVIDIRAEFSEVLQANAAVSVVLNSGASVLLSAGAQAQTLVGSYTVQPGDTATNLDVVSMTVANGRDLAGNSLASLVAVPAGRRLADGHDLMVDGAITILTPAGFSTNASAISDLKVTVTSITITFSTPVTGVSLANFKVLYNGRSVSLRGASVTGSGDTYILRLPSRVASLRGIYTLLFDPTGISASNGKAMTAGTQFYWGKGRSVGVVAPRIVTAVRR